MEGQFQHLCRRCKEIESGAIGSKKTCEGILYDIAITGKSTVPQSPALIEVHYCNDGGMGIADLIGFALKEEIK